MDRREFLKTAGLGSLAITSLALAPQVFQSTSAAAAGGTNFHFVALSRGGTADGIEHWIAMSGDGAIAPGNAVGGGSFVHFDNASLIPRTVLATGNWKAKRLVSFDLIGTWGVFGAGILEMDVRLVPVGGRPVPALLKVVCNLGPAGIFTGQDEGYSLSVPGAPFSPFVPVVPALGLTVFTTANERRD